MPTSPATLQRYLASFLRMIFQAGKREEVVVVEEERPRWQWRWRRQEATRGFSPAFFDVQKRGGHWLVAAMIEVRRVHVFMLHISATHARIYTHKLHTHTHTSTHARKHAQMQTDCTHNGWPPYLLITLAKGVLECVCVR